jgi:PBSX family phage terminase large subunit
MKTVTSLIKWYRYVINSPENVFLMSGNTLGSISRNCLQGDFGFLALAGGKAVPKTDTDGSKFLQLGKKKLYYCGADNVASFKKIRGLSIGGWYADEINLHDRDFIETALARSFASQDRQNIWTLNPGNPNHWIYTDYIDKYRDEQTPGYHWYHFTLDDNPSLTTERKAEIAAQFSGVFYKRYVLGLRVRGEGGCFPSFRHNKQGEAGNVLYEYPAKIYRVTLGVDFGGNKSATAFNATGWFIGADKRTHIVTLEEEFITGVITPDELNRRWIAFYRKVAARWPVDRGFADSAEQILRKGMNAAAAANRVPLQLENALKSEVLGRIRLYDALFSQDRAHVMAHCKKSIEAWENAVWNEKNPTELERLDDGTTNIDSLDAAEYAVERDATMLMEETR